MTEPSSERLHPLAECEKCPLRDTGSFVPSYGPTTAKIAFVGEAAGQNEVTEGRPFVGISGQLLGKVLTHHGMTMNNVFLTNATLCRPRGRENTTPPPEAVRACKPRLVAELKERDITKVVTLGNVATQALLNTKQGITEARVGLAKKSPLIKAEVFPTFHPAYCLRTPDGFPSMVKDIGKLMAKQKPWVPPEYKVFDAVDESVAVLDELYRATEYKRLVVDIECDIEKDTAFDHPNKYDMLCVGIAYAKRKVVIIERNALRDQRVRQALRRLLESKQIAGQNLKFDLAGLYPLLGVVLKAYFDTMLASYALDERRGIHSLGTQGIEILGTPDWKHALDKWNPKKNGYGVIPADELDRYNAYDCSVTWDLMEYYEPLLDKKDLRRLHDHLIKASNEMIYTELNGIGLDLEHNRALAVKYLSNLARVEDSLQSILDAAFGEFAFPDFNPRSWMQVKAVLAEFDVHVASTNEETLRMVLDRQTDPTSPLTDFLATLLEQRREQKLYSTYVKGLKDRVYRGRVYPTFLLHGTTTGRLSCRNPNLQNIPRESIIRDQFVPTKPGNVFVQTDMSQAELRVLTWLAQEEYFQGIFNDPSRDLFDELTPRLYPDLPPKSECDPAEWKETRIRVKAYVYGLSYGREAMSIAQEFKISYAEAQRGLDVFFSVIPEVVKYQQSVKDQIRKGKDLVTPFGRHRRFHLLTPQNIRDAEKEALAFRPQSISSDICLQAFYMARPKLKGVANLRNIVHDSILAECRREDAEYVGATLNELFLESARTVVGDYVQFATETKIGTTWGQV